MKIDRLTFLQRLRAFALAFLAVPSALAMVAGAHVERHTVTSVVDGGDCYYDKGSWRWSDNDQAFAPPMQTRGLEY